MATGEPGQNWRMCSLCSVPIASVGCAHIERIEGRVVMSEQEHERLLARIDEAQLRSIEARNPGIDMDRVRAIRAGEVRRAE